MNKKYILKKLHLFGVIICTTIIFLLVFISENIAIDSIVYAFIISSFFFLVYFIIDYYYYIKKVKVLKQINENIFLKTNKLVHNNDEIELLYIEIIKQWEKLYNQEYLNNTKSMKEMSDFYTTWVHQIKTPIFALSLLIKDTPNNSIMKSELIKIQQYSDMILGYLRLHESHNDLVIKEINLKDVISDVLKNFTAIFLAKNLRPILSIDDYYLKSDEKHLKFAISQIISNATKYSENDEIIISLKNNVIEITDKGIGIEECDIPRIFDKGYTGYSGRVDDKSSGLGLFLCKGTLDLLGFKISVISNKGINTSFFIDLRQEDRILD